MIAKEYITAGKGTRATVRFIIPNSVWADTISLVGDFNDWNRTSHPFHRDRDGKWTIAIDLDIGHVYQFRYLLDGHNWMNEAQADGYVSNQYGSTNGLVITDPEFHCHKEPDE